MTRAIYSCMNASAGSEIGIARASAVKLKKCLDCPSLIHIGVKLRCSPCASLRADQKRREYDAKRKAEKRGQETEAGA